MSYHGITLNTYSKKNILYLTVNTSSNYLLISCSCLELRLGSVLLNMFKGFLFTEYISYLKNYIACLCSLL